MKLLFVTNNQHKISEISALLPQEVELVGLSDIGIYEDIPETGDTLKANALQKAEYVFLKTKRWCFADDTGLEVEALGGAPGIHSARYAGEAKNSTDNVNLLLKNLKGVENRNARFKTVIALIFDDKRYFFEGIVEGKIIDTPIGTEGFGYDPVFIPNGYNETFAQMPLSLKNTISHRAKAINKLIEFIRTYAGKQ
ncbi:MAG TPA: non-canonical purine NTP diphosphatase [Salinivirgaceae bacterium]|nr:non-canonical purine NTP diphosphatase [Salinivirgaceae bacterium]